MTTINIRIDNLCSEIIDEIGALRSSLPPTLNAKSYGELYDKSKHIQMYSYYNSAFDNVIHCMELIEGALCHLRDNGIDFTYSVGLKPKPKSFYLKIDDGIYVSFFEIGSVDRENVIKTEEGGFFYYISGIKNREDIKCIAAPCLQRYLSLGQNIFNWDDCGVFGITNKTSSLIIKHIAMGLIDKTSDLDLTDGITSVRGRIKNLGKIENLVTKIYSYCKFTRPTSLSYETIFDFIVNDNRVPSLHIDDGMCSFLSVISKTDNLDDEINHGEIKKHNSYFKIDSSGKMKFNYTGRKKFHQCDFWLCRRHTDYETRTLSERLAIGGVGFPIRMKDESLIEFRRAVTNSPHETKNLLRLINFFRKEGHLVNFFTKEILDGLNNLTKIKSIGDK